MGQANWGRLRLTARAKQAAAVTGRPMKALTRSTPIALMLRDHAAWLLPSSEQGPYTAVLDQLGSNARAAHEAFTRYGALFPVQLGALLELVPAQVDDVLGELAAAGLVTSDGYPALRTLIGVRPRATRRRRQRSAGRLLPPAGRWTLLRSPLTSGVTEEKRIENWCRLLLRRYGVMFRELVANESVAPRWGELVRVYRRLEARGEIRFGRFVEGVGGEQFALPETVPLLRADERRVPDMVELPATDPINLTGRIMAGGPRVPALPGHSIAIVNGARTLQNV
jgi:ATP-dependent Lhr-like helicase